MNTGGTKPSSLNHTLNGLQDPGFMADFLEAAFDAVIAFDPQERITYWNPAAKQMFGWEEQEALGKTPAELFWPVESPEDQESRRQRQSSLQQGAMLRGERNMHRKDGSSVWVQYTVRAVSDADGKLTGYLALCRDISVQARLQEKEEQLKQSNQKLNEILDSIRDDFYVLDRDWKFVYASRSFTSKTGKEPGDFIGNNIWQMFPKHAGTILEENFRAAMEQGEVRTFEVSGKYTNAWYRMKAFPSLEGITVLGTDITERKRAEQALQESEERYRHLVRYAPAGIYEIDIKTRRFIDVNDSMCRILGYRREELLSMLPDELLDEEGRRRFRERMVETLAGNRVSQQVEYKVRAKDGHHIWAVLNTTVNYDHGQPSSVSVIAHDITERKRQEELSRTLNVVNDSIHATLDLDEVLQRAADQAANALGCDTTAISLQEGNAWVVRYVHGLPPDTIGMQMNDDEERHARLAVQTKLPVAVNDAFNDERFNREHLRKWGVRSVLVVPLIIRGEARGVIFFNYQRSQNIFTDNQIDFATKLSASLSLAVESARLLDDLQRELIQRKHAEEQLRELSQRLTYHVDNSPLAVIEWGSDMRLIRWSSAAEQMFGWKAEEVLGKRMEDFRWIYEEDIPQVSDVSADLRIGADPKRFSANRNYRKDGSVAYCEWYNSSLVDESGNLRSILSLVLDVTERKRAEEALRRQAQLLDLSSDAILVWEFDGGIQYWNKGAERLYGYSSEEAIGRGSHDLLATFHPQGVPAFRAMLERQGEWRGELVHRTKDGRLVTVESNQQSVEQGGRKLILESNRDITERKRAEDALRENEKQLQLLNETLEQKVEEKTAEVHQLASDLIKAVQHERHRISHILHDDLQQRIYAIRMQLSLLGDEFQNENESARKEIPDIEQQLAEVLKLTRHLSIDLSPPILRDEGLSHAIQWLAGQMRQQYGLPIELQANGPFALSNEALHVLLFNCVRELLFNVVKHARASRAVVALQWLDTNLRIDVCDDGEGFPFNLPERPATQELSGQETQWSGFGLSTIRHQLSLFGGQMEIQSEPGAGTRVVLIIPVTQEE